ncbi:hypothetical protein [Sinosporangium siamense]|uniref:Fibronectin type-III domain-containing protein n=1 Tax=Sinosporangium siamense TaxID=1367973 RepID=A0A919RMZ1_9ACTN|nr:hypothetical protein [Sinosporangium siamense]GII96757.1 hypothetical protein Ssi02_69880 [Sinosporangium siamense]
MAFDEARYIREVLDAARAAGGAPPADVLRRYQLTPQAGAAEVTETVRQVRQCWRRSRQMLKYRKVIDRLEVEHTSRYAAVFQAAAGGDLGPLRAEVAEEGRRDKKLLAEARRRLSDAAGKLRMLPPDLAESIVTSSGVEAQRAPALFAELGVEVREPDRLPQAAPYPAWSKVRAALDTLQVPHLGVFLFEGERTGLRVLGRVEGVSRRLGEIEAAAQRRTRGVWSQHSDTVCAALRAVEDPMELVRYDVVSRLRERIREHPYDDTLLRHATVDLRLDDGDARRLVFAVRHESGVVGGPAARLRELIEAGEVQAAAAFAEALPADALAGEAGELATEVRARVGKAVALRDRARDEPDPDAAWIMLEDALRQVPDLPGAQALLEGLPPRPPVEVRARVRGDAVVVTWEPSPSRSGEIDYDVHRDGVRLAEAASPGVRDEGPPVNARTVYAVTARRGRACSPAVPAPPVVLRPEVRGLQVAAGDGVVTGRWTAPAQAARVVVTRDGIAVPTEGSGFRDRGVRNGAGHEYLVKVVYPAGSGEVATAGLRRTASPQARPEAVAEFSVESRAQGELLVRCAEPRAGAVEFLSLAGPPPWPQGTTLHVDEVRAAGRAVQAACATGGFLIRPGRSSGVLLAVTVAGDLATVGAHREHVNLPAPERLTAMRRGPAVYVGMEWPPDVNEVEVRCGDQRFTVSAAAYRSQGGIRLEVPEGEEASVEVAATVPLQGERVRGPSASVRLPAVVAVRYTVRTTGPLWRRELVVELSSDRPVCLDRLVLVLKAGGVQPRSADDGLVLGEWSAVAAPARLALRPARHARPYWLRCFAEGDAVLVDPPVRFLKVD